MPKIPGLTNRGPAGLLKKVGKPLTVEQPVLPESVVNNIHPSLEGLVVDVASLVLDPNNARLHPERSIEAIKESLIRYGQRKPIVVRKGTNVVVAGNGLLESARALGWTKIAALVQSMTDADAIGYGLADNRVAEMSKWDFETVARLDRLQQEAGGSAMVGWTKDELEVLRTAEWTPPEATENGYNAGAPKLEFSEAQQKIIDQAVAVVLKREGDLAPEDVAKLGLTTAECVKIVCKEWLDVNDSPVLDSEAGERETLT